MVARVALVDMGMGTSGKERGNKQAEAISILDIFAFFSSRSPCGFRWRDPLQVISGDSGGE